MFVGQANKILAEDVARRIEESGINAVMVFQKRQSDFGFWIKIFGTPDRTVVNIEGLQVISRKTKS